MESFLKRFTATPLGDIFADQTWVSVRDTSLRWLNLPPEDFLDYARTVKRAPYDAVPADDHVFRSSPTFLLAQAHRIWVTVQKIDCHLPQEDGSVVLDIGAYPFSVCTAIRRYLKRECRILATINQLLSPEEHTALAENQIELLPVNLDPLVIASKPLPQMTDCLPIGDNSVDFVVFAHVIEHLYHPIRIMQEISRVLKPGGKVLLSTDNAFMIGGLLNYLNNGAYLHEPVDGTAAMVFHEWRGHVRYFSEGDLRKLSETAGLTVIDCELQEILYNSVPEEYFVDPFLRMPRWRADLLTDFPNLRNEILMIAEKPAQNVRILNPFDYRANDMELEQLSQGFETRRCDLDRSTSLDLAMGHRLLLGRWPTSLEVERFRATPPNGGVDGLLRELLSSTEFTNRQIAIEFERPAHDCIVMTETPEGLRFFFSVRDTFVGFPVAVGVFEPDVQDAFRLLVRPGMNCLDIGANIGYYSIHMAAVVARMGGRVFSFEPDEFAFGLLTKNCQENRLQDVITAFRFACGSEDGEARLYKDPNPANYGGMSLRPPSPSSASTSVPLRRLDSVISPGTRIDFAKIDVEGYEALVLDGMRRIIAENSPILLCEFNTPALRTTGADGPARFLEQLSSLGYLFFEAGAFGKGKAEPFKYPHGQDWFANLVCLPKTQSPDSWLESHGSDATVI